MTLKHFFLSYDLGIPAFPRGLKQVFIIPKKGIIAFSWNEVECEERNGVVVGYEVKLYSDEQVCTKRVFGTFTTVPTLPQWASNFSFPKAISVAAFNEAGIGSHCPPVNISELGYNEFELACTKCKRARMCC